MPLTHDAFASAYERHARGVLAYCRLRVGDAAEDVAQQVWLQAWERRESYEDRGLPLTAWLFRIAQSRCVDAHRVAIRRPTTELQEWHAEVADGYGDVDAGIDVTQLLRHARLTAAQRRAVMFRLHDWTVDEAAWAMDTTIGSYKALLFRAKANLLEVIDGRP